MSLKETLSASILSTSIALSSAVPALAESNPTNDRSETETSQQIEQEDINYAKVLYYIRKYLNIDDISNLQYFYEQIASNPKGVIERIGDTKTAGQNSDDLEQYIFYVDNKETNEKSDQWSMMLSINNSTPGFETVNFAILINKNGHIFDGDEDNIGQLHALPPNIMATTCDFIFNTPLEMKGLGYNGISDDGSQPFFMSKEHKNEQGATYTQTYTGDNIVALGVTIPNSNIDIWKMNVDHRTNPLEDTF